MIQEGVGDSLSSSPEIDTNAKTSISGQPLVQPRSADHKHVGRCSVEKQPLIHSVVLWLSFSHALLLKLQSPVELNVLDPLQSAHSKPSDSERMCNT